jgi:hypothetical protein
MSHAILDPRMLKIANEILEWARTFLMAENPEVKRPYSTNQAVCPFVRESVGTNSFYLAFQPCIGAEERQIRSILLEYIDEFRRLPPFDPHLQHKKCLLVVFPDIPESQANVLDIVHENAKTRFVEAGLMIGQFHPRCDVRGIHNSAFRAARGPYPLVAIRNMEVHDIVFLSDWKHLDWFAEYNARYGERFRQPESLDETGKGLLPYFLKAREAYVKKAKTNPSAI